MSTSCPVCITFRIASLPATYEALQRFSILLVCQLVLRSELTLFLSLLDTQALFADAT